MTSASKKSHTRAAWQRIRSIAEQALDLAPEEQTAFVSERCSDDPEAEAAVLRLLELDREADPALDGASPVGVGRLRRAVPAARESRRIGPYTLRRELGAGGMGSVWLAVQAEGDFHRRVAIKLLNRGMEKEELLARFQRERQVLANLDHPGIARLIDGGLCETGEPYLVMEYVEGVRIDRWCDEQGMPVEQRLELFRRVCDAVQHAHQRLVVHRDIKPTNILVTADGTPKLLDFGIAKVLDPEKQAFGAEVTQDVMRFFTPSYASPEQARGQAVTTASDVYSLGVLLYQLLTGRLPHRLCTTSSSEIARILTEVEPERPSVAVRLPRPEDPSGESQESIREPSSASRRRSTTARQLARALSGDLDRIVLKALRPEPLRRYPTVHELSEDVRRCLAGLPVSARPDSPLYRASRFLRRNTLAAGLAALLFLSLCAGLISLGLQYRATERARSEEHEQRMLAQKRSGELERLSADLGSRNVELEEKRQLLERAIADGKALTGDLERARALAESRFADIRRFTTTLLFDVLRKVYVLEGSTEATGLLVQTGLDFLDRLASESSGDTALQRELAFAYLQLAEQQAGAYTANLGQLDKGVQSIEKAAELATALFSDGEPTTKDRALLTRIEIVRGDMANRTSNTDLALGYYEKGVEYSTPLENDPAASPRELYALATAHSRVAAWLHDHGILEEAEERYSHGQLLLERLATIEANAGFYQMDLSILYGRLAAILNDRGDTEQAIVLARKSLAMAEALARGWRENYYFQRQYLMACFQLGDLLTEQGELEEARERFGLALVEAERACAADAKNDLAARDLVLTLVHAAGVEFRCERWEAALALCERALPTAEQRVAQAPEAWLNKVELAQLRLELGRIQGKRGNWFEAGGELGRVGTILDGLWEPARSEVLLCRMYAQTAQILGAALLEMTASTDSGVDRARGSVSASKWLERSKILFERIVEDSGGIQLDRDHLESAKNDLERARDPDAAHPVDG